MQQSIKCPKCEYREYKNVDSDTITFVKCRQCNVELEIHVDENNNLVYLSCEDDNGDIFR